MAQTQTLEKRDFVIKELIDTEHNYVEVLNKLKKNFMKPLQSVLDETTHTIIFYKISVGSLKNFVSILRSILIIY